MDNEPNKDFIDGEIINWDKLSLEELTKMREKVNDNIQDLLKQIDEEVNISD